MNNIVRVLAAIVNFAAATLLLSQNYNSQVRIDIFHGIAGFFIGLGVGFIVLAILGD